MTIHLSDTRSIVISNVQGDTQKKRKTVELKLEFEFNCDLSLERRAIKRKKAGIQQMGERERGRERERKKERRMHSLIYMMGLLIFNFSKLLLA